MQLSGPDPGMKILDVGSGFGRHSIELAKRGFQVTGVDISKELIEYSSKEAGRIGCTVKWICGNAREMAWHEYFDIVLNCMMG